MGIVAGPTWQLYVDGVLENSRTYTYTGGSLMNTDPLIIGKYFLNNAQFFSGQIDEVRVWRTVRTTAEIQANMCRKFVTVPADLVAYYRLDQGSGLVATDHGSVPTNGTLTNFAGNVWGTSGAPIGDASVFRYQSLWAPADGVGLLTASGDSAVVRRLSATTRGVQLYTVNSAPSIAPAGSTATSYVGVFTTASSTASASYSLRLRPANGPSCRNAYSRLSNDLTWILPTAPPLSSTSLLLPAATYRGEYLLTPSAAPPFTVTGDPVLCPGRLNQLAIIIPTGATVRWNTGSTTTTITATQPGTYTATVTLGTGCVASASLMVRAGVAVPAFTLGPDTTLCEGDAVLLRGPAGASSYQWSDGSAAQTLLVSQPGTYTLQATAECGPQMANRRISTQSCLLVPNVITPNDDRVNDQFVVQGLRGNDWSLAVYNRWGRQVLQTSSYHNDWGSNAAPGIYYVLLRRASTGYQYKGWLEVLR